MQPCAYYQANLKAIAEMNCCGLFVCFLCRLRELHE